MPANTTKGDQEQILEESVLESFNPSTELGVASGRLSKEPEPDARGFIEKEVPVKEAGAIKSNYFDGDDEWKATVVGAFPSGGRLAVYKRKEGTGYTVANYPVYNQEFLPNHLTGWFTKYSAAEKAARLYLNGLYAEIEAKMVAKQNQRYKPKGNGETATEEAAS